MTGEEVVRRVVRLNNLIPHARPFSPTGRRAARQAAAYSDAQAVKVLWALLGAEPDGMTYDELEDHLGMRSAKQRLSDLKDKNLVVGTGDTRTTRWTGAAEVYRPTSDVVRQVTGDEQTTLL